MAESEVCYLWIDLCTLFTLRAIQADRQNFRDHCKSVAGQWQQSIWRDCPGQSGTSGGYVIHLSSGVYYTTQASIHPSTDTRKAVSGCLSSPHAAVQMHTVVHTPRLGTYSWLRAARCPPCVLALSWLIESQH